MIQCFIPSVAMNVRNLSTDQAELFEFMKRISDPHKVLANNWSDSCSVCNWIGISCDDFRGRVKGLNLPNIGLSGNLPPHLGNLSFSASLNLTSNNFYGHLPPELGQLKRLKLIDLSYNALDGQLPSSLGTLQKVKLLVLGNNSFRGPIPPAFFNMSNLETLDLSYNSIQGNIPDMSKNLQNLKIFYVTYNQLIGIIPPSIYNISSLRMVDLASNKLSGSLPDNLCENLPHLVKFRLGKNMVSGHIPSSIGECSNLQLLSLSYNHLDGHIPESIGNLTRLEILFLGANNLHGRIPQEFGSLHSLEAFSAKGMSITGPIPPSLFNISSLTMFDLDNNSLSGELPDGIGNLHRLETLELGFNNLSGRIPLNIFNISTIVDISLQNNHFYGQLPPDIGHWVPNLQLVQLWGNNLNGVIPSSISNASKLRDLFLADNIFHGLIPNELGNLRLLERLVLDSNNFAAEPSNQEWSFLSSLANCRYLKVLTLSVNPFNRNLPASIGNLSQSLGWIDAFYCNIDGNIPPQLGNLSSLFYLQIFHNEFSGSIPETIGNLKNLQGVGIYSNKLRGSIPDGICSLKRLDTILLGDNELQGSIPTCLVNLTRLSTLHLSSNNLSSSIPSTFWTFPNILDIDLSSNALSGSIPPDIAKLKVLIELDLSNNVLSGDIPTTFQGLQNLQLLSLSQNKFQGHIPESFGGLISLETLNLSYNNLTGFIPKSLVKLSYLKYLDLSFNRLEGEIPTGGPFANFSTPSFMHNHALCGSPPLQVPSCKSKSSGHSKKAAMLALKYLFPTISFSILIVAVIILFKRYRTRSTTGDPAAAEDLLPLAALRRISFQELTLAVDGFDESNFLGSGSFGSVYKGMLSDGSNIAVKVFNLQLEGALESFFSECEVMRNIRHRNLVKVISGCCNIDFKALVLEFMPRGSLEKWLYSHNYFLDIFQRLDIMIDGASALEYLHYGLSAPVIHCDVKPSNVLLDEDMVGHLSDFGISKLLGEGDSMTQTLTLATMGYMPPEFGSMGVVSVKGDVYSYGILLMETFTRRKPTDEKFDGEMSISLWVREASSSHENLIGIADDNLLKTAEQHFIAKSNCISSVMGLALECSAELPEQRKNMKDVVAMLQKIKAKFLKDVRRWRA